MASLVPGRDRAVRPQRLVHHRERVSGQSVLAGPERSVFGTQPAAVPQRGRDRDASTRSAR